MLKTKHHYQSILVIIMVLLSILSPLIVMNIIAGDNPQQLWIKYYDDIQDDKAYAVTTDSNDNIIVTGHSKISGLDKCLTVKYSPTGSHILTIISNTSYVSRAYDIAVDSQDNIIIAGCLIANGGGYDFYIAKYDPIGNELWFRTYDSDNDDIAYGIAVDSFDNIIVVGIASQQFFTIKYDKFGIEIWNRTYYNINQCWANSVSVDNDNNIIVTGNIFTGSSRDWFTVKYNSEGIKQWSKTFSNGKINSANSVATDSNNNIFVCGAIESEFNSNMDIIKYDPSGNEIFHKIYDKSVVESGEDIIINSWNEIIMVGSYAATFEKRNFALVKFDSEGTYLWSTFFDGNSEDDYVKGVAIDTINKMVITGHSKDYTHDNSYVTIKYGEKPIANFSYSPLNPIAFNEIQFHDGSRDPAGEIVSWFWDFGDGDTSTLKNPTHIYRDDGTKTVLLTVIDDDNSQDTITKQIQVLNANPIADFSYMQTGTIHDTIIFNDSSFDLDGNVISWSWNFGDGNFSTGKIATHQYENEGPFTVTLTVTDNDGGIGVKSKIISSPPPKVTGLKVKDAKDGKLELNWDPITGNPIIDYYNIFRDGSLLNSSTINFFIDTGLTNGQSYSYQISAVSIYGKEGEKSDSVSGIPTITTIPKKQGSGGGGVTNVIKNKPPVADGSAGEPYIGLVGEEILFDGSLSYDVDGDIVFYHWNFNDGFVGSEEIFTHSFSNKGTYNVKLTVTDDDGEKDTYETIAIINIPNRPPTAPIITGPKNGTKNTNYTYFTQSTDVDNDLIKYFFDWDDDIISSTEFLLNGTKEKQVHMWNASGKYIIKSYASDNESSSDISEYIVFIDAVEIKDLNGSVIGYLKDIDGDGIYDAFYSNELNKDIIVKKFDEDTYLIDTNDDGSWDLAYNSKNKESTSYEAKQSQKQIVNPILFSIFILLIFSLLLLFVLIFIGEGKLIIRKINQLLSLFLVLMFFPILRKNMINADDTKLELDDDIILMNKGNEFAIKEIETFVDNLPEID